MKICSVCETNKDEEEFAFRNKNQGTRQSCCRSCHSVRLKEHYKNNTQYYKEKARRRSKEIYIENRYKLIEYLKNNPCVDCGETDIVVLQFDHLYDKKYNVSHMISDYSWSNILKEITKCEVVCANDHTRRTAQRANWFKLSNPDGEMDITTVYETVVPSSTLG